MLVTKDLQIPIINSRCAELLDLPPDFIKNPPRFDGLSSIKADRQARRERRMSTCRWRRHRGGSSCRRQVTVSERQMPNGSVIEVRSGHLPDGSFVQTFTDITNAAKPKPMSRGWLPRIR